MAGGEFKFGIEQFTGELGAAGFARPALYYVLIHGPVDVGQTAQYLPLRVERVNFPGRSLTTAKRQLIGPARQVPYAMEVLPVQMDIILSETMRERQYFMNWQDQFTGPIRTTGRSGEQPGVFDIGYYEQGIGTIEILQFAESPQWQGRERGASGAFLDTAADLAASLGFEKSIVTHPLGFNVFGLTANRAPITHATKLTLHEAYPFTINDLAMGWNEPGYAKLTVEFRYVYFTEEHKDAATEGQEKSGFRQALEGFGRFMPAVSLIKNAGFKGAAKAVGRSFVGAGDGLIGTFDSLNPF